MKEIAGNLKKDVKDLLDESANIVSGFFRQGLCTVRGAVTRWKNFTQDISGAVGTLFQPFENAMPPAVFLENQPMVTVMESEEPELPVGTRMTLYEAETRVNELNYRWSTDGPKKSVRLAIDYTMEGEQDRYWLPLDTGPGCRPMLQQMEDFVTGCLKYDLLYNQDFYMASEGLGTLLQEHFGPQVQGDLEKLSTKVLLFFRQHCNISALEQQFEVQAQAMPEKERDKFKRSMAETVASLRIAANTAQVQPIAPDKPQEQPAPVERSGQDEGQRPLRPVKLKIQEIKAGQAPKSKTTPQKGNNTHQR